MSKILLCISSALGLSTSPLLYSTNAINNVNTKKVNLKNNSNVDITHTSDKHLLKSVSILNNTLNIDDFLKYLSKSEDSYKIVSKYMSPKNDVDYF
jgi:hypothetical protein